LGDQYQKVFEEVDRSLSCCGHYGRCEFRGPACEGRDALELTFVSETHAVGLSPVAATRRRGCLKVGETLLEMTDVKIYFPVRKGVLQRTIAHVKAVDGISLTLEVGDALGLVGESGSGKTTLVSGVTMLEPLTAAP